MKSKLLILAFAMHLSACATSPNASLSSILNYSEAHYSEMTSTGDKCFDHVSEVSFDYADAMMNFPEDIDRKSDNFTKKFNDYIVASIETASQGKAYIEEAKLFNEAHALYGDYIGAVGLYAYSQYYCEEKSIEKIDDDKMGGILAVCTQRLIAEMMSQFDKTKAQTKTQRKTKIRTDLVSCVKGKVS